MKVWIARQNRGLLGFLAVVMGLIGGAFLLRDEIRSYTNPDSRVATREDVRRLDLTLRDLTGRLNPEFGGDAIKSETERMLREALSPTSTEFTVVREHLRRGRMREGIATLERFADVDLEKEPPARAAAGRQLYLAALLAMSMEYSLAERLLKRVLEVDPTDQAREMLGIVYLNQGRMDEVDEIVSSAFAAGSGSFGLHNLAGLALLERGDLGEATSQFQVALARARSNQDRAGEAAALGNLGLVEGALGNVELSDAYLKLSIDANRGSDPTLDGNQYCNLGRSALSANDREKAERYYQLAVAIFWASDDRRCLPNALIGLGAVRLFKQKPARAAYYFEQAKLVSDQLEDRDNQIVARHNLGVALRMQRRYREAEDELSTALVHSLRSPRSSATYMRFEDIIREMMEGSAETGNVLVLRRALIILDGEISRPDSHHWVGAYMSAAVLACIIDDRETMLRYIGILSASSNQQGSFLEMIDMIGPRFAFAKGLFPDRCK